MKFIPITRRLMTLAEYRNQLEALKKMRENLGLDESVSLQLLIDEAKSYLGEK